MSQTKLCKDSTILKLNVGKHGVDCINTKDFTGMKSHMLHVGYGPYCDGHEPKIEEIIQDFKEWYNVDNVELSYDNDYEYWRDING